MARIVPRACILVVVTASGLAFAKTNEAAAEVLARPASAGYRVISVKEVRWLWGDVCVGRHRPDTQSGSWTDPLYCTHCLLTQYGVLEPLPHERVQVPQSFESVWRSTHALPQTDRQVVQAWHSPLQTASLSCPPVRHELVAFVIRVNTVRTNHSRQQSQGHCGAQARRFERTRDPDHRIGNPWPLSV
jgi:hypothetical protein